MGRADQLLGPPPWRRPNDDGDEVAKDARQVVSETDLSDVARALAPPAEFVPDRTLTLGANKVPDETEQALKESGMQTGGAFAPGRPISPFFPWGQAPRQWDYPIGYNIATRPRTSAGRVSFDTIRQIILNYDVARICIEVIQDEIRGLDWAIVPADGVTDDAAEDIAAGRKFFDKPDGHTSFKAWQAKTLENVLQFDALAWYRQRNRAGKLIGLDIIDGASLAPMLDYWGRRPRPPAPAVVQFIKGMPAVWLRDDEVIYEPYRPQADSPYGLPPVEWMLLNINTHVRLQWYFLQWFTDGTIPDTFMQAPPDSSKPDQLIAWQEMWDQIMQGDQAQKHKVKWIPSGAKPVPAKVVTFDVKFAEYLLKLTCAGFKVTPAEIGFTADVNRATAKQQSQTQGRIARLPRLAYLQELYTRVLQDDLGLRVQFQFNLGGEQTDKLAEAQAHKIWVEIGAESPDEIRSDVLGKDVDIDRPVPRFILTAQGPVALSTIGTASDPLTMEAGATGTDTQIPATNGNGMHPATAAYLKGVKGNGNGRPTAKSLTKQYLGGFPEDSVIGEKIEARVSGRPPGPEMEQPLRPVDPSAGETAVFDSPASHGGVTDPRWVGKQDSAIGGLAALAQHIGEGLTDASEDLERAMEHASALPRGVARDALTFNIDHSHKHMASGADHMARCADALAKHPELAREIDSLEVEGPGATGAGTQAKHDGESAEHMEGAAKDSPDPRDNVATVWHLGDFAAKDFQHGDHHLDRALQIAWAMDASDARDGVIGCLESAGKIMDEVGSDIADWTAEAAKHPELVHEIADIIERDPEAVKAEPTRMNQAWAPDVTKRLVDGELKLWRSNTLKRLRTGKPPKLFTSEYLPPEITGQVWRRLEHCRTPAEVGDAFRGPFLWG